MKKLMIGMVMLVAVTTIFSSCKKTVFCIKGEGNLTSEIREVSDFDELDISVPAEVYITQDKDIQNPQLTIEAQGNVLNNMETYVSGDKLKIKFNDCVNYHKDIKIHLTVKDLSKITLNGSGNVYVQDEISSGDLKATINGSGDMEINMDVQEMTATIQGSGNLKLKGNTEDLTVHINGSGDVRAFSLDSEFADVNINGSGKTQIQVSNKLDVDINGSGDVYYKGYPQMSLKVNGSGKVVDAN